MKTYIFQGYSDDTFSERTTGNSQDNCANGTPLQFDVVMPDGSGLRVTGCYGLICKDRPMGNGCWMIGVELLDEEKPVNWKLTLDPSYGYYCGQLTVEAPDESKLAWQE